MTEYEGMMLDCGLKVKNCKIVDQPPVDQKKLKKTIEAMQVPQPHTVAKKKALAEMLAKKRR